MSRPLTKRQRQILEFIVEEWWRGGPLPTLRDIGAHFEIRSTNGVADHLKMLTKKGALRPRRGRIGILRGHVVVEAFIKQLEHEEGL